MQLSNVSELGHYTQRALTMDVSQLMFAIKDIKATLEVWKDAPMTDPYVRKLWAEFDAYTVRLYKLQKRG